MTCRQAFDIDLAAFLAEPGAAAFERFRAHYLGCADCAAEVRAWTDVHLALSGGREIGHPEPAALLAFDSGRPVLPEAERRAVEAHLAACRSCRDELAALHAADRAGLAARAADPRPSLLDRVRALVLHPAFAYALVLVLAYPAVRGLREGVRQAAEPRPASTPLPATPQRSAPAAPAAPAPPSARTEARREPARDPAPQEATRRDMAPPPGEPAAAPAARSLRGRFDEGTTAAGGPAGVATLPSVDRATAGERVTLRVPAPPAAGGSLEVRVAARDGRREIRERIDQPAGAAPLVLEVPAVWLEPGSYAVEVRDPASGDEPVATYGLTVR